MRLLVASEEWILAQTPRLRAWKQSVENMQFPDAASIELFAEAVEWQALLDSGIDLEAIPALPRLRRRSWAASEGIGRLRRDPARALDLWAPLLRDIESFQSSKFYLISGSFETGDERVFRSQIGFEGVARLRDGGWRMITGLQSVAWERGPGGDAEDWRVIAWLPKKMETADAPRRFFEENLASMLPHREDLQRARASLHEENLVKLFTTGKFTTAYPVYSRYRDLESSYQHPGLAVADVDNDGWDDLYVMGRWGPNQLWWNRGDGTFTDRAAEWGLDLADFCSCAVFADNDGDLDVFVGRTLARSVYLENEGGYFRDRSAEVLAVPLPPLVSSMAAADYDGDGLLDIYFSLYGPTEHGTRVEEWAGEFFSGAMADELIRRSPDSHRYLDLLGPPNLLLRNRGGRFEVAPEAGTLAEWRNTYQSTWADYDGDGDPDLYVCNDFAPDSFYRNEGKGSGGKVVFREIAAEAAGETMNGFGMGASWGDYDLDGRLDLYVSNMYSKAGTRITRQLPGLDARIPYAAAGSLLFRNEAGGMRQAAGLEPGSVQVAKVGWAYGGLFLDADNDGYLDVYSASGYYTAPEATRSEEDL
ncbi:MAG TPA: VCBS repeat-containing protein [Verrucomicrobiales bacterium]|nr:VCBS repeat-containing protein [Verrucomicrobiales bacterium]